MKVYSDEFYGVLEVKEDGSVVLCNPMSLYDIECGQIKLEEDNVKIEWASRKLKKILRMEYVQKIIKDVLESNIGRCER